MNQKRTAVYAIFHTEEQAGRSVDDLLKAGFSSDAISVLLPGWQSTKDFAHEKNTKAPEGATAGVTAGGAIGGALGVLAGFGALAIPGVGVFLAAGPILSGLAGMGAGGAVGGFLGALVGMGIPEFEAKRYAGHVKEGGVLLSVHCDTAPQIEQAKEILKFTGGQEISTASEASAPAAAHAAGHAG